MMKENKLTVARMHRYVNSVGEFAEKRGFRFAIESNRVDEKGQKEACVFPPTTPVASDATVLRWMHACNAEYGNKHVKGSTDRRNDADVVLDRQRYTQEMGELQKWMMLFTNHTNNNSD